MREKLNNGYTYVLLIYLMCSVRLKQLNMCAKPTERETHKSTLKSAILLASCSLEALFLRLLSAD